jgi:putative aminopeptidase FrvX
MKALIQKIVEIPGPSGYESKIREIVRGEVEGYADELRVDSLGNLIVRKATHKTSGKRIMLAAHIDEIGVIATHIDENGFVRFTTIGGVRAINCPGGRVRFLNGSVGVIGIENPGQTNNTPNFEHMYIDLGVKNKDDCPVRIGDVAAFERPFLDLGQRLVAKSMDDRIGTAILIETLRQVKDSPHELYFVFSVQEEVGVRGATTAAYGIDPDLGLAVDVTGTGDTPKGLKMEVSLGEGPAIKVRDAGMLADPRVVDWMVNTAEKEKIPCQLEILERGGTDARAIQLTRAGVPAGCLSVPCRYVHSPSEMVDYGDVLNSIRLLVALLSKPVELKSQ